MRHDSLGVELEGVIMAYGSLEYFIQSLNSSICSNANLVANEKQDIRQYQKHLAVSVFRFLLGICLILVNFTFLVAIKKCRLQLQWKRICYVTSLSVADFLSGFCLCGTAAVLVQDVSWLYQRHRITLMVQQTFLTAAIWFAAGSFTAICRSQHLAITKPFKYHTISRRSLVTQIVVGWSLISVYCLVKLLALTLPFYRKADLRSRAWHLQFQLGLSVAELVIMYYVCISNCILFSYVLYVAARRQYLKGNADQFELWTLAGTRRLCGTVLEKYRAILTTGMSLLVYIVTFLPLLIVWTYDVANPMLSSTCTPRSIYYCQGVRCSLALLLYFCRGLIDPVIYSLRETHLTLLLCGRLSCVAKRFYENGVAGTSEETINQSSE